MAKSESSIESYIRSYDAYFTDVHAKIKGIALKMRSSKLNGDSLDVLEKIGDRYAAVAPKMLADHMRTLKGIDASEMHLSEVITHEGPKKRGEECWHDGIEEWMATRIYDIVNPKKRDSFLNGFFNKGMLSDSWSTLCYYSGPHCSNNYLFEMVSMGGNIGKRIAFSLATNMERIIEDRNKKARYVKNIESIALDAKRFYKFAGNNYHNAFMGRMKKNRPDVYSMIDTNPENLFMSTMHSTFQEVLDAEKEEISKLLNLKV